MTKFTLLILTSLFAFGCSTPNDYSNMADVDSELIAKGNLSGIGTEAISNQYFSITNQTEWENFISQIDATNEVSSGFSEQNIDFSEYVVIAVIDQVRNTSGYSIDLEISTNYEKIFIGSNLSSPSPDGVVATVISQPYHIVKIAKTNLPIDVL
jgi:hypothetical protein